ncbi:hypothetical protein [Chryseobacterium sp. SORGH_AS_0447]|uniref:bacteriocin-like protein n=1 Tax=Chryseobacterium sp. SORGH_AS_0447 TaxID=3041769 RepID=UPI0025F4EEC5|nr:hypothetical protein [Chryseobacterium sp. SORGH_AS_0447]MDQ1160441.1 hypothetical protein [Chryseobacterium sp. SORGH_AS_0447]
MKNLKKLSRQDLKDVFGGRRACSHFIQSTDGQWIRRDGECVTTVEWQQVGDVSVPVKSSYCDTGLGHTNVTSNGGQSRC